MRAIWNKTVLADSENTILIEGNHYFPPESVNFEYLAQTDTRSTCPWKGIASYFSIQINSEQNPDAAWTYTDPKPKASNIKDHIAFWKGVVIEP